MGNILIINCNKIVEMDEDGRKVLFCFVCVGVLRPSQQRGHVEQLSVNSGTVPGQV